MSFSLNDQASSENTPLTREDVIRLLKQAGSPRKLNLSNLNLTGIELPKIKLNGADLSGANLSGANLSGANLRYARLENVDLHGAKLHCTDLTNANLRHARLESADLRGALLVVANLRDANLFKANLGGALLLNTDLRGADLRGADLRGADLNSLKREGVYFERAKLDGAKFFEDQVPLLENSSLNLEHIQICTAYSCSKEAISLKAPLNDSTVICIRLEEEPLTAKTLSTLFSVLTELYTISWLIAQARYTDLTDYTRTKNPKFEKEANLIVDTLSHHPPFNAEFKIDNSFHGLADALSIALDSFSLLPTASIETCLLEAELHEYEFELERKNLIFEKEQIRNAFDLADMMINRLQPNAVASIRTILKQSLVPALLQLANLKGLSRPSPQANK